MKRVAILLAVFVMLAWFGSKFAPRTEPTAAQATAAPAATQAVSVEPEKPLSAAEKKAQQERWFGARTIVAAERAVRNELKDPDSAQFRDVRANYTEEFGVVACGRVNAKNDLGGYTGFRRFVSGGQSVILEERDNIAEAWTEACL